MGGDAGGAEKKRLCEVLLLRQGGHVAERFALPCLFGSKLKAQSSVTPSVSFADSSPKGRHDQFLVYSL